MEIRRISEWSPRRSSRRHVVFVIPLVLTGGRGLRDREQKVQRSDVQHQSPLAKNGKTTRELVVTQWAGAVSLGDG